MPSPPIWPRADGVWSSTAATPSRSARWRNAWKPWAALSGRSSAMSPIPIIGPRLVAEAAGLGGLDLLVNNASELGPSPLPSLEQFPLDALRTVYEVNVVAPLALVQLALPLLRRSGGTVVSLSSDAAVEAYEGWGGYGSSKAALDQLHRVLAVEEPKLQIYQFDPGDMRTDMHQAAFPGEDISDRPEPESVVPALQRLLRSGGTERSVPGHRRGATMTTATVPPADVPPADVQPADVPPADVPPADVQPADVPSAPGPARFTYDLPAALEASEPPEARGLTRDAVRMLVATKRDRSLVPSSFSFLPKFLEAGDTLVVNTSGTIPAAVEVVADDGSELARPSLHPAR